MIDRIKKRFLDIPVTISYDMVMKNERPHTPSVEHLSSAANGPESAAYYFLGRYFGTLSEQEGIAFLKEIKGLQYRECEDERYGCLRWYREEPYIFDTNGAFFVLLPLALACLLSRERISGKECEIIEDMLSAAGVWFLRECKGPLFYTNKIVSDGAMLALIAKNDKKYKAESEKFWIDWLEYANLFGFGWGENLSDEYTVIILRALVIARSSVDSEEIKRGLDSKIKELLDYTAFHGGKEFIPTIRTYNFDGSIEYGGELYEILFHPEGLTSFALLATSMLFDDLLPEAALLMSKEEIYGTHKERIFKDSYAYTWKTKDVRLGSVSHFPVMPGCYQNEGWGLGWQSMPVSALIPDEYISFLRLRTEVNSNTHSHPAMDKHSAYLYNRLFEDANIPKYTTLSSQNENIVIAIRAISHISNKASLLADEWATPGKRVVEELDVLGRSAYLVDEAILVIPLRSILIGSDERVVPNAQILYENGFTTVTTPIHKSEYDTIITSRYSECAWVIIALTDREELTRIKIIDTDLPDRTTSRGKAMQKRKITVALDDKVTSIEYDPYDFL